MANNTAHGPVANLPWAGKLVRMEDIQDALTSLWNMSLDNVRASANRNVRTSVLNLVICAPDLETAQHASRLLRSLASTHLARVTVLVLDRDEQASGVHAWVTLRCFSMISDVMRHCFEQTTLRITGRATRAVSTIVQPLLKPHLPVYLWWLGDPPAIDDPVFRDLISICNRAIFDSTGFFHPEQDLRELATLCETMPNCAMSDLNWGRLNRWRELVSQFFDAPEYRQYLTGIHTIEIEHAAAPLAEPGRTEDGDVSPNPIRALLLAAWLKERLGWTLDEAESSRQHDSSSGMHHWTMRNLQHARNTRTLTLPKGKAVRQGNDVTIDLRPSIRSGQRPGSITLIRLASALENRQAVFTIERENDPDHVSTSVELDSATRQWRIVSLPGSQYEVDLLRDELEITGHDALFEQTLQGVAELLEAEG